MPQLEVSVELLRQQFQGPDKAILDRDQFLRGVTSSIEDKLSSQVLFPFRSITPALAPDRNPVPDLANRTSKVRFLIKARVTNVGTLTSTISNISVDLREHMGERWEDIGFGSWPQQEVELPQGKITALGNVNGETVDFDIYGNRFLDYQVVETIGRALRDKYPREFATRHALLESYLRLFAADDPARQERLVSIADPANHAHLDLVMTVRDIYGRVGFSEDQIIGSGAWN